MGRSVTRNVRVRQQVTETPRAVELEILVRRSALPGTTVGALARDNETGLCLMLVNTNVLPEQVEDVVAGLVADARSRGWV